MACKKKDTTPPDPGPDDQVLSAIHQNGVLTDSFYYNKQQQIIHYIHFNATREIDKYCDMTYDNEGGFTGASLYFKNGVSEKNQAITTAGQIRIVGNIYYSNGTIWSPYTTILKLDNGGRFVSMLDTVHAGSKNNILSYLRWIDIQTRKYDDDKLVYVEMEGITTKYDPATPNIDTIVSDKVITKHFEYGNTPNKLYPIGKKNPYLLVIIGAANPFYAGSTNVTKTTEGNNTTVFQDIEFTSGFYVRKRKETITVDGVTSTINWEFYYSPVSSL